MTVGKVLVHNRLCRLVTVGVTRGWGYKLLVHNGLVSFVTVSCDSVQNITPPPPYRDGGGAYKSIHLQGVPKWHMRHVGFVIESKGL